MVNNKEIHDQTNSFMGNKDDWEGEYEDQCESLRTEQHSSVKEREQAVSEREQKVKEWEEAQREQAKAHGFYGVAQIEEQKYSHKFKFSGTGEGKPNYPV